MLKVFAASLLGLLISGLVNQLGSDLALRRQLTRPHCSYCGQERRWWRWISLPSFLIGRAQCPSCGAPISIRHPLIEVGLGVTYGYLWIKLGPSAKLTFYSLYSAIFALILVTDVERRLIPNTVTYPAMLLALAASLFLADVTVGSALIGGTVGLAFFFIVALIGRAIFDANALGGGDVKLAALIGLITGFPMVIEALVLAIFVGAAVSLILLVTGMRGLRDHVPYGPFLIAGAMITLLWGYPLAEWFLR